MTERYGSGTADEGQRPSGRGAVTERLAGREDGAGEIDLTDEAAARDAGEDRGDRESSGAFEPAAPTADPPAADTRPGSSNIFDVDQRAEGDDGEAAGDDGEAADITPTPVPAAEPSADAPAPHGLPEPATATEAPAAADAPAAAGSAESPVGSLDVGELRNRFLDIQAGFVDEPRQAVEEAGRFVDDLVRQVAEAIQQQRGQLGGATPEGSTEDLRLALRAYRQFVDRLLGMAG
jgi:hypothetical protein